MIDVMATLIVKASPEAAAQVMFDPGRDAEWIGSAERVKTLTPPPLRAGYRVRREGSFLGQAVNWVTEITAIEAPERMVMRILEGPFRGGEVTYLIGPFEGGARVSIRSRERSTWPVPFMGAIVGGAVRKDLARLKQIVEREN